MKDTLIKQAARPDTGFDLRIRPAISAATVLKRRRAVSLIIGHLENIRDAEQRFVDAAAYNAVLSEMRCEACRSLYALDDAICILRDAF